MDEHPTRGCPVGVSCFRCGKRGHRVADCPMSYREATRSNARECARCGSGNHIEVSCPTYWRIYAYVDEEEWQDFREDKARELGVGGSAKGERAKRRRKRDREGSDMDTDSQEEGETSGIPADWDPAVSATYQTSVLLRTSSKALTTPRPPTPPRLQERWCYNCASRSTHWGDDCPHPRRAMGRNGEPSIFSEFISSSGPFAHRLAPPPPRGPAGDMGADLYDVSVGPTASMHFFAGGPGAGTPTGPRGAGSGPARGETLEEYIDGVFARAPRSRLGRVERDRRQQDRE